MFGDKFMINLLDEELFEQEKQRILKKYNCKDLDEVLELLATASGHQK